MSHSCRATILWVMPAVVYTSWPLPPLHPCHSPGPGQGWVCDDAVAPPDSRIATPLILTLILNQCLLDTCTKTKLTPERLHLPSHTCLDLARAPASWSLPPFHLISLPPLWHECIYIYLCMYIYMHMHVYIYIYIHIYMYIYIHIYAYTYIYTYIYICMYIYTHVYVYMNV